jgi:acetyltransferase-like isoleucine patch superfamily enzyme
MRARPPGIVELKRALKGNERTAALLGQTSVALLKFQLRLRSPGVGNRVKAGPGALLRGVRLDVDGDDNVIVIGDRTWLGGVTITIRGDRNRVIIGDDVVFAGPGGIWVDDDDGEVRIGSRCSFEPGCTLATLEGQTLTLGEDCMLAGAVEIRTGDSHAIFALEDPGERINSGRPVTLGDHVWVGKRSFVLKGVTLAGDVIVGAGSIVSRTVDETNVAIAGSPARIVRRGVGWQR